MAEKMFCPHCGEELTCNGYNYDDAHVWYYCEECDMEFNDETALDEDEVMAMLGETNDIEYPNVVEVDTEYGTITLLKSKDGELEYDINDAKGNYYGALDFKTYLDNEDDEDSLAIAVEELIDTWIEGIELHTWNDGYDDVALGGHEVITWPESQAVIERIDHRSHSYLINDEEGLDMFGSSAYVVESDWYHESE